MIENSERVACLSAPGAEFQPVLRSVHASGEIQGLMLRMRLRQLYRNAGKEELETVFSFPLAWGTTLLGMRVTLNGKEMTGAVIVKKEAEEKYEDAIASGDLPVMLVCEGKDVYSARLGNLKPGDEASIEIEYGQMLRVDQGQVRLTVPTTIAPRFGRDPGLSGLMAHAIGAVDPLAEHRFHLALQIHGPLASAKIHSPSHAVAQQATSEGVRIELSQRAMLDRDFILGISGLDDLSICTGSDEPGDGEGCTLVTGFVPRQLTPDTDSRSVHLKILVDCSGSMAGDSIRLAREGLESTLAQLREDDHVSFSCFGSSAVHMHKRMAKADDYMIQRLIRESRKLEAELGGTELDNALREVIAIPGPASEAGDAQERSAILLITDGDVWDIDGIVRTARASGHTIYAIGVSSAPAESLLRELAEVTGGGCELLAPNEEIAGAASRMLSRMRSAAELEIELEIDGEALPMAAVRRRVAPGEIVQVWCQLAHRPARPPLLRVREQGATEIQMIESPAIQWGSDSVVARLGAAQRLLDISDEMQRREIALKYQLVTEQSSFFLVHERAALEKASGVPALQQVGNMMAAGWGGTGSLHACMSVAMADDFDISFSRLEVGIDEMRSSVQTLRTPAVFRRASSGGDVHHSADVPRAYANLAQAVANPDELDNPLAALIKVLAGSDGGQGALKLVLDSVATSPSSAMLSKVMGKLVGLVHSDEAAMAVLLDWANRVIGRVSVPRRCLRPVNATMSKLAPAVLKDAVAYLDKTAAKRADPLPPAHETYDIPAFLRRQAD